MSDPIVELRSLRYFKWALQHAAHWRAGIIVSLIVIVNQGCAMLSGSLDGRAKIEAPSVAPERVGRSPASPESANVVAPQPEVRPDPTIRRRGKPTLVGAASWYGPGFHGEKTASGKIFDQSRLTAAHKSLPLGSRVKVTNLNNGNSVVVEITDRGPFVRGRIIDLSESAARTLDMIDSGTAPVRIEILSESAEAAKGQK